ncbi:MAG: response regulator, partial [Treponema sp.]|nr:response regulator [Treponema sp.]
MSYKVLIIEDDPMVAMINEQYATKNPNFVSAGICRNGKDALEFLSKNKVDLVVLDVYMPYMDGVETLKKIREQNIQTEVIMVTAANDTSTLEKTMNLGVVDYLVKPFAMERFQVALEKFAAKAKALRGNKGGSLDQSSIDTIISGTAGSARAADTDNPSAQSSQARPA